MFDALSIGATGIQAQQAHVEAIAHNLANVNTSGFKKTRVSFSDLVVSGVAFGQRADATAEGVFVNTASGAGVQAASIAQVFSGGDLKNTGSPMDVAINGDGFLELAMPDGTRAYARGGTLKVNDEGLLANAAGVPLKPGISVPADAQALVVSGTGRVQARLPGQAEPADLGQLELVRFPNAPGLLAQGGNVYRATDASGEAIAGRAGEDGMGSLAQGFLEGSNVKLVEEMVDLMVAQRAYEASVKVVQASDEMLGMVNGLRR
jgi:flagellar basal-body rod protein FlgG